MNIEQKGIEVLTFAQYLPKKEMLPKCAAIHFVVSAVARGCIEHSLPRQRIAQLKEEKCTVILDNHNNSGQHQE